MVEDEETGRKLGIPISSDSENPGCRRESRLAINTPGHSGKGKISVWGNIWKRNIHRVRNLVVARRNPESSGRKESNIQADPDDK